MSISKTDIVDLHGTFSRVAAAWRYHKAEEFSIDANIILKVEALPEDFRKGADAYKAFVATEQGCFYVTETAEQVKKMMKDVIEIHPSYPDNAKPVAIHANAIKLIRSLDSSARGYPKDTRSIIVADGLDDGRVTDTRAELTRKITAAQRRLKA